ncbi:MAG: hypothetical protein JO197_20070 [Acidobacteria bacterium]|nr:hypothetical protein [Acidobacteriota bacterium]MBV9474603.1 hypothetical protein [Acidobacteriota bacterium]
MKRILAFVLGLGGLLSAAVVHANPPGPLADWGQSPQAYFMTSAERMQWAGISTSAEAETFVDDFVASRGGTAWLAEVEKRTAIADKYLSFGKVKGSQTIGGKMLVLFGAPDSVEITDRKVTTKRVNKPMVDPNNVGGTSGGLGPAEDGSRAATTTPGSTFRDFTFTFFRKSVPGLQREELITGVTVDLVNGKMALKDKKQQADLDAIFESVAAASVVKK